MSEWDYQLGPPFLLVNERFNSRVTEKKAWQTAAFDDSHWKEAESRTIKYKMLPYVDAKRLAPRTIPALPELQTSFKGAVTCEKSSEGISTEQWNGLLCEGKPLTFPPNSTNIAVIESEALTTGFLQFQFRGGSESELRLLCAECFEKTTDKGFMAREKGNRADFKDGVLRGPEDILSLGRADELGDEPFEYEPFWFRTFRYIRIAVVTGEKPLEIIRLDYRATHYPLEITTDISDMGGSANRRIWDICVNTLRNCMHETYEDCPFYEQNQFAFDSRLMMLFTYQLSHDDRLQRKTIQEFFASQQADGLIQTNFPNTCNVVTIPTFSLSWILMLYDHMMFFGDAALVRRYIGAADTILDYFDNHLGPNGLVGRFEEGCWAFVDWVDEWNSRDGNFLNMAVPPAYKEDGYSAYNSLVYAFVLQHAAELCSFLGRNDQATEYRNRATAINNAINTTCFITDTDSNSDSESSAPSFYVDGPNRPSHERSQHVQVFAILSGAITGPAARTLLIRSLTDESFAKCSYSQLFYVFRAAALSGAYDDLYPTLIKPWERMVKLNLTTCPEAEAMPRSDCHGWSASPIHEMVSGVFGLEPASPGFERIKIAPRRGLLGHGRGRFAVVGKGVVEIRWGKEGEGQGEETAKLSVLPSMDVEVEVDLRDGKPPRLVKLTKDSRTVVE